MRYRDPMTKTGRPRFNVGEKHWPVSVSLGDTEIDALRELSRLCGESQGAIVGRLVVATLIREQRNSKNK